MEPAPGPATTRSVFFETEPDTLRAEPLGHRLRLVAGHFLERAGEHDCLAGDGRIHRRLLGIEDGDFLHQRIDDLAIVRLAEIARDRLDDRLADLVDVVHFLPRLRIAVGDFQRRVVKRRPRPVAARELLGGGLADMADAE